MGEPQVENPSAQQQEQAQQQQNVPGGVEPAKKPGEQEAPEEKPVITHHKITVGGTTLAYTATAGRMPIKNEQQHTEAQMFYVAYTLDGANGKRPLTFAFNGGPGSATIWLHMGCFGPKRVKMLPNGFMPSPPFQW
jgi:carboxypeptidase C (cathepsin A)